MTKTGLTENMLRIYEGLREEDRILQQVERFKQASKESGLDIENLINEIEEKPYRSEVEGDGYQEYLRNKEAEDQENFRN